MRLLLGLVLACSGGTEDTAPPGGSDSGPPSEDGGGPDTGGDGGGDSGSQELVPDVPAETVAGAFLLALPNLDVSTAQGAATATWMSAGSVGTFGAHPLLLAQDAAADPSCPLVVETKSGTSFEGGCTDTAGVSWVGQATLTTDTLALDGFGFGREVPECPGVDESIVVTGAWELLEAGSWRVDVVSELKTADVACNQTDARFGAWYLLTQRVTEQGQELSGSGVVGFADGGWADAVTARELLERCGYEPDAGETLVTGGGHQLQIVYDGLERCTDPGSAALFLDGDSVGQLVIPTCASTGGRRGSLCLILLAMLGLTRSTRS